MMIDDNSEPHKVMDQLLADFKCAICLEVYVDATGASCGHVFCRLCITKWTHFTPKCPECHQDVKDLRPMENVDSEVDGLFEQLPSSVRRERDEQKNRRRQLEFEGIGNINQTNALLERLRSNKNRTMTIKGDHMQEKIAEYLKDYADNSEAERVQLPRLVSDKIPNKISGSSNKENVVKLPPIKLPGGRNARGVTTTTCTQNMSNKFPKGMEGDIPADSTAEESIRELERRNMILEEQLFGAYDRIISVIKDNDSVVAEKVDPNVFETQGFGSGSEKQAPCFSRESMVTDDSKKEEDTRQPEKPGESEVDDLLAETEELIEIEDFLKKYPFERISNDETLIDYDFDEEDLNDMNLDLLDADQLDEISAHRAAKKGKKPLTEAQQEIEDFYKKLETKQKKPEVRAPVQPRIPKVVTQMTMSSKLKRMPTLGKFGAGAPRVPSTISATQSHEKLWQPGASDSSVKQWPNPTLNSKAPRNHPPVQAEKQTSKSSLPDHLSSKPTQSKPPSISKVGSKSSLHSGTISRNNSSEKFEAANSAVKMHANKEITNETRKTKILQARNGGGRSEKRPQFSVDSDEDFSYDDFLKLEIDFLDGDGDWKDFEKPPSETRSAISYVNNERNPDAFKQIQERRARHGAAAGSLPYRANGRQFQSNVHIHSNGFDNGNNNMKANRLKNFSQHNSSSGAGSSSKWK